MTGRVEGCVQASVGEFGLGFLGSVLAFLIWVSTGALGRDFCSLSLVALI